MNVKRLIALGTALLLTASLAACGKEETETGYDYSAGLDKNGFFEGIKASEIVTLPEYKGVDIDKSVVNAADEDVQKQLDNVLSQYTTYGKEMERAVRDGDTVHIDYVGSIDGVEFEGGTTYGNGTSVTIGVTQYIDDFLNQLIGHKPGETFDIVVDFPDDYHREEVRGKEAVFVTTINYIQGDPIVPELTDEIAVDYGFETVDEMILDIEGWLIANQKYTFYSELMAQATCDEIPQAVMDFIIGYDKASVEYYATMYGTDVPTYLGLLGYTTLDEYVTANMETYRKNALLYLASQAIAEIEGITVSDAQLEEADMMRVKDQYGLPFLRQSLLFQEILPDFVVANGNIK